MKMIGQIYQKINPKLLKPKGKLLILELLSGYYPVITKENIMKAGYGENVTVAILAELKRLGMIILEKFRDNRGCFTAFRYVLGSLFKPFFSEKSEKEVKKSISVTPYIECWNTLAKKSDFPFETIPKNKASLFESEIKHFEQIADIEEYKKMVKVLMKLPYFRGENNSGFILRFHFILNPQKVKQYYQGGYFKQKEKKSDHLIVEKVETIDPLIPQFDQLCKQYYPKPNICDDQQKIEVMNRIQTEKQFQLICKAVKKSVKKELYLPNSGNFFDLNYKNNYTKYISEKPVQKLTKNRSKKLLKMLKDQLDQRYSELKYIFDDIDIRICETDKIIEIYSDHTTYLNRLKSNRFDIKIKRLMIKLTNIKFQVLITE